MYLDFFLAGPSRVGTVAVPRLGRWSIYSSNFEGVTTRLA